MNLPEFRELIEQGSSGELMLPEYFALRETTGDPFNLGGIGNIARHFSYWSRVAHLIGNADNVLDIGCGCGLAARLYRLRTEGRVVALDREPALGIAQALYHTPDVEYVEADLMDCDLPEGPFDVVAMTEVYEHLPEDVGLRVVGQIAERLAEGGRLVMSVPFEAEEYGNQYHARHFRGAEDVLCEVSERLSVGTMLYLLLDRAAILSREART